MTETTKAALNRLEYPLAAGYIHNWLVAGPYALEIDNLASFAGEDFKAKIAAAHFRPDLPFAETPAEQSRFVLRDERGEHPFTWQVGHTLEDHFVNLTGFYHTCHYLCAWAYAEVTVDEACAVTATLTTNGPADLWLNGTHCHRQAEFQLQLPYRRSFTLNLQAGCNTVLVRFENVAARACPYVMALHLAGVDDTTAKVTLPSAMPLFERRQRLANVFAAAYLEQSTYQRDHEIKVKWPADARVAGEIVVRLQTPAGRIYAEGKLLVRPGEELNLGKAYQYPEGSYQMVLMPTQTEYYVHGLRIQRRIDLQIANGKYSLAPYGSYEQRRREALDDAARRNLNLFSEIAKMALGRWEQIKPAVIEAAIAGINRRADCSDFYLTGLLGMQYRFGNDPAFPAALREPIEACILNFKYWMDEPRPEGTRDAMCYWTENHQILFHTCQVLAGQLYPDRLFPNAGKTGAWHRQQGERRAFAWLRKRAAGGFQEWDSNCYFSEDVLALSHLADLAETVELAEMAAVVLDKLFFTLAVNSFKGVFGSTHGRTYAAQIKSGRLEATAGISRLLWGQGVFNRSILGLVGLACAQSYELPPILAQVATVLPDELWSRERHAGVFEEEYDRKTGTWEVNKVSYKTPDYMLASAQDYQPGEAGVQQHIWQATFDPDAVVFVNHPHCLSEDNSHRPNAWHGNVILPRVAQWKDVLVAVHKLPADDWLGFTHAYFPAWAFDEYALRGGWAFARKGDGYLALTASRGLEPVWRGPQALEELRSYGQHNVWLLHMGRAALDGDFAAFQEKVLGLDISFEELSVHATTLRGESIDFGWEGPLLINEHEQPLDGFKHYDNLFCQVELNAEAMEIEFIDQLMRLDFSARDADRG
ncbi:MAG: hypothetical protein DCC55_17945 [Chloroflexi bacterium]|nr:MAG: hypothetical protein DCC55_17945 [Chloroflexota bacterium]